MAVRADDVDLLRDRALVERFQAGDDEGFEDLYRRYFPRLRRFCLKRLGDPYDAEEVAQEAFARALRAMPQLQGERRFYPWLTVIAGRLCVDALRRAGRTEPSAEVDLGVIDGGQEAIVDASDLTLLAEAMDRLSPRHREVLRLREHEGWTYHQIAAHLGCTQGTVEALLFRARRALRKEFHAVAGPGGWAAFPVVGWALRKLDDLGTKVAPWSGSALVPTGLSALSAVVIAGTVAMGSMVAVDPATSGAPATATAPPVVRVAATSTGQQSDLGRPAALREPRRAPVPATPSPSPAAGAPLAGRVLVSEDTARRSAENKPVTATIGDHTIGVDPAVAARIVEDTMDLVSTR